MNELDAIHFLSYLSERYSHLEWRASDHKIFINDLKALNIGIVYYFEIVGTPNNCRLTMILPFNIKEFEGSIEKVLDEFDKFIQSYICVGELFSAFE